MPAPKRTYPTHPILEVRTPIASLSGEKSTMPSQCLHSSMRESRFRSTGSNSEAACTFNWVGKNQGLNQCLSDGSYYMLLLPPVDKHPLKKLVKKLQVFSCALSGDAAPHSSRSARAPSATSLGLQPAPVMLGSDTFTDLRWRHQHNYSSTGVRHLERARRVHNTGWSIVCYKATFLQMLHRLQFKTSIG